MMTVMDTLEGKGAVITGGASGIGYATARELGRRNARVVIADIEAAALERAVGQLRDEGIEAYGVGCDVTSFDAVQSLAAESFDRLGAVQVVFNNAGVALGGPVSALTHDEWRWIVDVDLWGPIHGVEAFLPLILEQNDGGHLLFTASFAGLVPNVGLGAYCVAKYGVVALAEVLHRELRGSGIGASVLCPMRVATNIGTSGRNRGAAYGGPPEMPPLLDAGARDDLAGRILEVDDVARMTVDAIIPNQLYVLPHAESRDPIRRRFERIDRTFAEGDS
jgi:NAD(P)-dependent dehydrogenase (short-subunit alcohol dehydrogenase family)